ncbi:MAG: hypothetical protein IPK15_20745 [Verrucomicrobia bacterium]|nr:hypothetical protein [Verrucomicrobiota bacterium]
MHGASGNLLLYRALAEALAPDISVYGFQARGLDGKSAPFRTIEEMASHYVRRLRHVQPSGKYHLAGYCMGGAVVYEMARQIAASGEVPGFLGLFDSYNLGSLSKEGKHRPGWSALWQKAAFHFQSLREMSTGEVVEYLGEKLRMAAEAARGRVRSGLAGMGGAREGNQWDPKSGGFVQRINDEAAWRYLPPPSQLQLTLFRPRANYDYLREENMGWSEAVGERIELMQMAANPHAMLLKPHVVELAGKIANSFFADDLTEQREISGRPQCRSWSPGC